MSVHDLKTMLIRDEGLRLMPYRDSVGLLTIGVGRCLDRIGISVAEAAMLLDNDIKRATADLEKYLPWALSLDTARQAALVNLIFNMGGTGLLTFKHMLAALESGNYELAAAQLLDSKYATQVGPRAHRVAQQLLTGEWIQA